MLETFYKNYKINAVEESYEDVELIITDHKKDIYNNNELMEISNNQETSIILYDNNGALVVKYGIGEAEKRINEPNTFNQINSQAPKNKI